MLLIFIDRLAYAVIKTTIARRSLSILHIRDLLVQLLNLDFKFSQLTGIFGLIFFHLLYLIQHVLLIFTVFLLNCLQKPFLTFFIHIDDGRSVKQVSHRLNFFSFLARIISAHKRDGYHHKSR
ncbi:Uncharacterised protein [Klebsiella pneumoniae]|nr:Uncharacterised protein [Klebsiella pneumoniae]SLR80125.1 Uncharacterised protein [Klebsiella pneumoniae]SLR87137.1 Uncharacterised protein [Klebsiella pneumoniae]SLS04284.1 Uncharacterised protein [Klebsiella pneumoniae]